MTDAQRRFIETLAPGRAPGGPMPSRLSTERFPDALYVIGDVHGRLDLLDAMEREIIGSDRSAGERKWLVLLGDIIDRGPDSARAIDHVLTPPPAPWQRLCLCGNHEAAMVSALDDPATLVWWLGIGGMATLVSYGMEPQRMRLTGQDWPRVRQSLLEAIPGRHLGFMAEMPFMLEVPGYVMVHAGLRPDVPMAAQSEHDMIWIREPFLDVDHDFGPVVVHGHTIVDAPEIRPGRIGIDTGAFATGVLTAVRLTRDREPEILQVRG